MSIWKKIGEAIKSLAEGGSLSDIFQNFATPPEKKIGFTIAVIALSAKMAKADGIVSKEEVAAFKQIFEIPQGQEKYVSRVYNLARQDVSGYEIYARKISKMLHKKEALLTNLIEGLLFISISDGKYHPLEDKFINTVSSIFSIPTEHIQSLKSLYGCNELDAPYQILRVRPNDKLTDIRRQWRKLVLENHPDRVLAKGLPKEAIKLANARISRINSAWEKIKHARQ